LGRRAPFNAGVLLNATKRSFEDSGENEAGVIAEATPASKRGLRIDSIIKVGSGPRIKSVIR